MIHPGCRRPLDRDYYPTKTHISPSHRTQKRLIIAIHVLVCLLRTAVSNFFQRLPEGRPPQQSTMDEHGDIGRRQTSSVEDAPLTTLVHTQVEATRYGLAGRTAIEAFG